ncbi:MAG: thioredoxin domain-containing protein [Nanoarchaeota archaeon]|nr:thioredoxin domain-containing protein [Nanoarchaeota archaeon]
MEEKTKSLIINISLVLIMVLLILFSIRIDFFFPVPETGLTSEDIPKQQAFINTSTGTNPGAPIDLIEFSDFGCVYSKQTYPELKQILERYGETINFVFKHLPQNNLHPNAFDAAVASECARNQGKFIEYHDVLFESGKLDYESFISLAESIGLDIEEFYSCIQSGEETKKVMADMREAQANNIRATPIFIINGDIIIGSQDYDSLEDAIERQLDPEKITEQILGAMN